MGGCGSNGGEERFTFDDKSGLISTPAGECIAPGRFSLSPSATCTTLEIAGSTAGHNGHYVHVSGLRDGVGVWRRSDDHEIFCLVVFGVSPISVLKSSTQLHPKTKPHHHRVIGLLMMRTVCLSTAWTAI